MSLPLIRHSIRRKDLDFLLVSVLQDRLVSGDFGQRLAVQIAQSCAAQKAFLHASASTAVASVVSALGLSRGDKVVLSVLAPPYWAHGFALAGVECLWADVAADSPVLDVTTLGAIDPSSGVKAIVADCALGYYADLVGLSHVGVPLVNDVSQGLGGLLGNTAVEAVGDLVFMNFGSESLLAGPGGCALCARKGSLFLPQALEPEPWDRMSDVTASLILSQWPDVSSLAQGKRTNFGSLFQRLPKGVRPPKQRGDALPVGPVFPVVLESGAREALSFARHHAVEADWAFRQTSWVPATLDDSDFPHARAFVQRTLAFPLYSVFGVKELETLGKVLASLS